MSTKSFYESTTAATNRKVQLAGFQRLLSHMNVEEPEIDQTHVMRLAEERVYAYTKTLTAREVRDQASTIYAHIETILAPFDFKHKPTFLALWTSLLLTSSQETTKTHLEAIRDASHNNELKRLVVRDIRTPAKYKGILKRVLNFGEPSLNSLFAEVDLTTTERIQRAHAVQQEAEQRLALDALLDGQTFEDKRTILVATFYQHVRQLSDPVMRNTYFNKLLVQLVTSMRAIKGGPEPAKITLFVQLYDRLVNHELVATVDPRVTAYLVAHPIDFFAHSLQHMAMDLEPHSPFKGSALVLDPWQREVGRAVKARSNILLNLPTAAGKTIASTVVIRECENSLFVMPSVPLAEQFTGIVLATALDLEGRKHADRERNVRLELDDTTTTSYRRFHSEGSKRAVKDNIVIGMARKLWELLHTNQLAFKPEYIVLDEGHNLGCPITGPYYEYIIKYAAFHKIPFIIMTATLRDEDYERLVTWLKGLYPTDRPLLAVCKKRRFFNQQRIVFRQQSEGVVGATEETTLDPLRYVKKDMVRSPLFRHPGLVPGEVYRLYERVTSFPRIKRETKVPTLDTVEQLEEAIFRHIATLDDEALGLLLPEDSLESPALTPFQIYMKLRSMDASQKPLLLFKMESEPCLKFFARLVQLAHDMSELVYGNFQDDQTIVKQCLEELSTFDKLLNDLNSCEKAEEHAEKVKAQRDSVFATKYSPRLRRFYKEYVNPAPDPVRVEAFNTLYGATITHEYIVEKRKAHAAKQLAMTAETVQLRTDYTIHDDVKLSTYSGSSIMKDIRDQVNDELEHQRKQTGPFRDMRDYGVEFDGFNDMEETLHLKRYDPKERKWRRSGETETRRLGRPWQQGPSPHAPEEAMDYTYRISYENMYMKGIEIGLILMNTLLNPAFTRVSQLLISQHPLIVMADRMMTAGVNYPFRGVWFQGGCKGEAIEPLDSTSAIQGSGRAGRRGIDKKAVIYATGIDMTNIMMPQYRPVGRNDPRAMEPLVEGGNEAFRRFVVTEEAPATAATATATVAATASATAAATATVAATVATIATIAKIVVEPAATTETATTNVLILSHEENSSTTTGEEEAKEDWELYMLKNP